ncbi:MAG: XRE family transcriptional regulator [Desulfurellales bacterium]|nr:MAG: XRE family transcriptional regulator [Desulfurellales bacterium]
MYLNFDVWGYPFAVMCIYWYTHSVTIRSLSQIVRKCQVVIISIAVASGIRYNSEKARGKVLRLKTRLVELMAEKQKKTGKIITQADIAREVKMSPATISRWVHGDLDRIDVPTLLELCKYFNCRIEDLLVVEEVA